MTPTEKHALFKFIGKSLKRYRKELGLNQTQLAKEVGFSRAVISNLEAGTPVGVSLEKLVDLSFALGVGIDALLPPQVLSESQRSTPFDRDLEQLSCKMCLYDLTVENAGLRKTIGAIKCALRHANPLAGE